MKPSIKRTAQAGFTLIELIVVIVILGILAATALPKFASLGADARAASLKAAAGAMSATASMVHGKYLVTPLVTPAATTVTMEGVGVKLATTVASGYPMADSTFLQAAGLSANDYTFIQPATALTANSPATSATEIAIIPNSVAGTPTGATCYVKYQEPTSTTGAPQFLPTTLPTATSC